MNNRLIVAYPYVGFAPGRFFEDALRAEGFEITRFDPELDFNIIDQTKYDAVLFIENLWRTPVEVKNINKARLPKFYWILHGESRLKDNIQRCKDNRIDCMLLAISPQLGKKFGVPYHHLPMAVDPKFFQSQLPIARRTFDISFIGHFAPDWFYAERNRLLKMIEANFPKLKLVFQSGLFLDELGKVYSNSKIVFNWNYKNGLTMRLFEGMAAGALMLTNPADEIGILGENRRHYVIYRNPNDLINKIQFYLKNPVKTQTVATNGLKKIMTEHTYAHRARQFKQILKQYL